MSSEYSGESERFITARCVLLTLLCAVALKSQAQVVSTPSSNASGDALAEIVVTATKRGAENVQTIPIAITAISQAELEARGAQQFEDYARSVPALSFVDAGPAFKTYVIRGINATGTGVATVGQYVDDVLITGDLRQPDLRLYDIQRIEVLRGPQGTLYGSGSLSGTIRTITNPPDPSGYHADVIARVSDTDHGGGNYGDDPALRANLRSARSFLGS